MRSVTPTKQGTGGIILLVYGATDIGTVRSSNQDAFKNTVLTENSVLSVVCDGMGGAKAGNVASEMAVNIITEYVKNAFTDDMPSFSIEKLLRSAIETANYEIFALSKENADYNGMGTTVVAAIVKGNEGYICHVGDSRAYIYENGILTQVTRDHSVVQDLLEGGHITEESARIHPRKNVITRALGTREEVVADFTEIDVTEKTLLICTDGLTNTLLDNEIAGLINENSLNTVPDILIDFANKKNSNDNITVICISM